MARERRKGNGHRFSNLRASTHLEGTDGERFTGVRGVPGPQRASTGPEHEDFCGVKDETKKRDARAPQLQKAPIYPRTT